MQNHGCTKPIYSATTPVYINQQNNMRILKKHPLVPYIQLHLKTFTHQKSSCENKYESDLVLLLMIFNTEDSLLHFLLVVSQNHFSHLANCFHDITI